MFFTEILQMRPLKNLSLINLIGAMQYPETRRDDFIEDFHGIGIPDPYRWLTDPKKVQKLFYVASKSKRWKSHNLGILYFFLSANHGHNFFHRIQPITAGKALSQF